MGTLDDFFGGGKTTVKECLYCGGQDGSLEVAVRDEVTGQATHWRHPACRMAAEKQAAEQTVEAQAQVRRQAMMDEREEP